MSFCERVLVVHFHYLVCVRQSVLSGRWSDSMLSLC